MGWIELISDYLAGISGSITYGVIWVRKLLRVAVKGFEVERFLLVKGDDFGKWSSVVLTEHLTLPLGKMQSEKMLSQLYPQARWPNITGENLILSGDNVVKMYKPNSILCCRLPAKSNRKGNQIGDGELTHLKRWRQNRTLHPKQSAHTQKITLDFMICRMFVQPNETRRDDALLSREEE